MLGLPRSTEFNKRIPKQKFYEHLAGTAALKRFFAEHLNSGLLGQPGVITIGRKPVTHNKVCPEDVKSIYAGHEVASHGLYHATICEYVYKRQAMYNAARPNGFLCPTWNYSLPDAYELLQEDNKNAIKSTALGFTPDFSPVSDQYLSLIHI